jgi:hypothetical protein
VQSRALRQRIVMNGQQEQGLVSLMVCLQRYETVRTASGEVASNNTEAGRQQNRWVEVVTQ